MSTLVQRSVLGRSGYPLDQVHIVGIAARGFHGVLDSERAAGQDFSADVTLYLDTRQAAQGDDLTETVNYALVAQDVADILSGDPVNLIETVAEQIAAAVLARPAVISVDVSVHKPQAPIPVPFDDVVVVIHRDRVNVPVVDSPVAAQEQGVLDPHDLAPVEPEDVAAVHGEGLAADTEAEPEAEPDAAHDVPAPEPQADPESPDLGAEADEAARRDAQERLAAPLTAAPLAAVPLAAVPLAAAPLAAGTGAEGPVVDDLALPRDVVEVPEEDLDTAQVPVAEVQARTEAQRASEEEPRASEEEPQRDTEGEPWHAREDEPQPVAEPEPGPAPALEPVPATEPDESAVSALDRDTDLAPASEAAPEPLPVPTLTSSLPLVISRVAAPEPGTVSAERSALESTSVLPPLDEQLLAEQARLSVQSRRPEIFGARDVTAGAAPDLVLDSATRSLPVVPADAAPVVAPDEPVHHEPAADEPAAPLTAEDEASLDHERTESVPVPIVAPALASFFAPKPDPSLLPDPAQQPEQADTPAASDALEAPAGQQAAQESAVEQQATVDQATEQTGTTDPEVDPVDPVEPAHPVEHETTVLSLTFDRMDTRPPSPVEVVVALGANLGDAQETLRRAATELGAVPGLTLTTVGPLARTAAVGGPDQPDFLNTVVLATTTLSPRDLLHACQSIENEHGRQRIEHWGPRTLDIDLIAYGALVASADDLEIPHPRANERAFVLAPWAHVDPDALLPGLGGGPVAALAATAPDRDGIRWLALDWMHEDETAPAPSVAPPSVPVPVQGRHESTSSHPTGALPTLEHHEPSAPAVPSTPPVPPAPPAPPLP